MFLFNCNKNIYRNSTTQISSASVFYKNGNSLSGRLNFPIYFNETIIYLKQKNKGYKKIKAIDIEKVVYNIPNQQKTVFSKFLITDVTISKTKDKFQFLELISEGKINLYYGHNSGFLYTNGKNKKFLHKTNLFYCKKANETDLTLIYATTDDPNSDKYYETITKKYFANDEEIKNKLDYESHNPENLIKIIIEYNKQK